MHLIPRKDSHMPKGLPRVLLIAFLLLLGAIILQRLFFSSETIQETAAAVAVEVAPVRVLDMNDYRYFQRHPATQRPVHDHFQGRRIA
jgi:hypothetical protein